MRKYRSVAIILLAAGIEFVSSAPLRAADPQTFSYVSDTQTEFSLDGKTWSPAVATWVHPAWPTLKGSTWIWTAAKVSKEEAIKGSPVVTFRRKFTVSAAGGAQGTLRITADNAYEASFNGKVIGSNGALDAASNADQQWRTLDSYTAALQPGENMLTVRAINYHSPVGNSADGESNPAGLIFSLVVSPSLAQTLATTGKVDVYGILFDIDKANIKPTSKPTLDQVAKLLKDDPTLKLEVAGHTDSTGSAAHNLALSQRRAAAVVQALIKTYGIDAARLKAKGYGDTKPVAGNDTEEGRAKNRRVELKKL